VKVSTTVETSVAYRVVGEVRVVVTGSKIVDISVSLLVIVDVCVTMADCISVCVNVACCAVVVLTTKVVNPGCVRTVVLVSLKVSVSVKFRVTI